MLTDQEIINIFFVGKSNRLTRKYQNIIDNDQDIKKYLDNRFCDSKSYKETLVRIKYKCKIRPVCPICGNEVTFLGYKNHLYLEYCSIDCKNKSEKVINKREQTTEKRYGVKNYSILNESKIKVKNTCIKKYNRSYPYNHIKSKQTKLERYNNENYNNIEQIKKTMLDRYGDTYVFNIPEFKEKLINTINKKYGVNYYLQTEYCREQRKSKKSKQKEYLTKKLHNSFNQSNTEDESYILLKEKYPDIIRQYRSELYPFDCDFYIPSLDLYIECNYHWTHGDKPYNENDKYSIDLVNLWKSCSTKYYNNAITTFTIRDVNKRNMAKQNNLNWIEFFNINELTDWIKNN